MARKKEGTFIMVETIFRCLVIALIIAFVVGIIGSVSFSWTLDTSPYLSTLSSILAVVCYVLPIAQLSPIIVIFVASMVFRIVVSIIRTIWSIMPISG